MQLTGVTADQMMSVNRYVTEELGIDWAVMRESAGLAVAEAARQMLGGSAGRAIVILVGPGQTGATGIVSARRLANWGARVTILLAKSRPTLSSELSHALDLNEQFGVKVFEPGALMPPAELIIDALVGTGSNGRLRDEAAELAAAAGKVKVPVLAIDLPSGLDPTTGKADQPAVRADMTIAIGYPKAGTTKPFARNLVGKVSIADISIPPGVWQRLDLPAPVFEQGFLTPVEL